MSGRFPAQDITCPYPAGCTVAVSQITDRAAGCSLQWTTFTPSRPWHRIYNAQVGFADPNPGFGDTRFAPFDDAGGHRVPTSYVAQTLEAALLETALHGIGRHHPRVISERALLGLSHARLVAPRDLWLIDMRDPVLAAFGLTRDQFASSTAEHYPCTRRAARAVHGYWDGTRVPDGIIWHSRQAELTGHWPQEVAVIFADRVPFGHDTWTLAESRTASGALLEGAGRERLDALAEALDITIIRDDELDS